MVVERPRNRVRMSTVPALVAEKVGDVWSSDFQLDSTITSKPVRLLSIVD